MRIGNVGWTDRNDDVDFESSLFELLLCRLCQQITHCHPAPVDGNPVDSRIRSGKVDKLEDVRGEGSRLGDLTTANSVSGDDDSLTYDMSAYMS